MFLTIQSYINSQQVKSLRIQRQSLKTKQSSLSSKIIFQARILNTYDIQNKQSLKSALSSILILIFIKVSHQITTSRKLNTLYTRFVQLNSFLSAAYHCVIHLFKQNRIPQDVEAALNIQLPAEKQSYFHTQISNFIKITQIIIDTFSRLDIPSRQWPSQKELQKMLKQFDLNILQTLLGGIFTILTHKQSIVMTITTLDQSDQKQIQNFILITRDGIDLRNYLSHQHQKAQEDYEEGSNKILYDQLQNLENAIALKQGQITNLKSQLHHLTQENQQLRSQLQQKCKDNDLLRKRLIAFQEVQTLLSEKDAQVQSLNAKLLNAQLKSKTSSSQVFQKEEQLKEKNKVLEIRFTDLQSKYTKLKQQYDQLKVRQENKDLANKKVISNLKQKVKQIQQKNNQQQRQLLEIIEDKQQKQKQYRDLLFKYEGKQAKLDAQDSFKKENQSRKGKSGYRNLGDQLKQLSNYHSHSIEDQEQQQCQKPDCKQLKRQYFEIINRIVSSLNLPQSAACRVLHEKKNLLQNYANKLTDISNENQKLKQKLVGNFNSQNDGQQVIRLKKKINVLKKRSKQQEARRKQQMDIMIAVLEDLTQQRVGLNQGK